MNATNKILSVKHVVVPVVFLVWLLAGLIPLFMGHNVFQWFDLFWLLILGIVFYNKEDRQKFLSTFGFRT